MHIRIEDDYFYFFKINIYVKSLLNFFIFINIIEILFFLLSAFAGLLGIKPNDISEGFKIFAIVYSIFLFLVSILFIILLVKYDYIIDYEKSLITIILMYIILNIVSLVFLFFYWILGIWFRGTDRYISYVEKKNKRDKEEKD